MATGIPGGRQRRSSLGSVSGFRLEYDGKLTEDQILSGDSAVLKKIISVDGTTKNRLIYGDNLTSLRTMLNDPSICGQVRLIYIDPPFATKSSFETRTQTHAYEDLLSGSAYLEFLRQRLVLMRELLAEDGSIYVHLDDKMAFPAKVIMDEVFGAKNFRNCITRKKCNPKNYTKKQYGNVSDYILFYSKTNTYCWNQSFEPWDEDAIKREYQYVEEGTNRRYKKVPVHAPGVRNGQTGKEWRGKLPPPGKHWQYTPTKLDEMDARGEIYWSPTGNPRRKIYHEDSRGIPVQDIWMDFKDAHNQNIQVTGYPTEKNPEMLKRIILASSNPGDLVLDAFSGSGTTLAVSEQLNRRWIGIDNSLIAINTIVRRLTQGMERMGDFVNNDSRTPQQITLLNDRLLSSGLDIYAEESQILESVDDGRVQEWNDWITTA